MDRIDLHTSELIKLSMYCSLVIGIIMGGSLVGIAWVVAWMLL